MMSSEKDASVVESDVLGDAMPSTADENSGTLDETNSTSQQSESLVVPSPNNNDNVATEQNNNTSMTAQETAEVSSSNDVQNVEDKEPLAPVDNNTTMDQSENTNEIDEVGKVDANKTDKVSDVGGEVDINKTDQVDANKSGQVDANKSEDEDEEDDGEEVKTYSGYVPISQISWDWDPPTSLDTQKKASPPKSEYPPNTSQDQDNGGNADADFDRKPVDGLVYTDVGEKAKPTPYIREIKARKFEKKAKNKLFVGGLTFEATESFLYDHFEKYGELDDACIVTEKGTGKSRGFGYVTFINQTDAEEAIKAIDGLRINGKTLCVEFADDPKASPRGPPSRGYRGRGRGRGYHSDWDRHYERDPYYDRGPDPYYKRGGDDPYYDRPPRRDYDYPYTRDYDRPPSRGYDRPPPRDYYDQAPPRDSSYDRSPRDTGYGRPHPRDTTYSRPLVRDYDRPPPRDYYDRPHARDPAYDRLPPRDYDDYRRPPASYDDRYPLPTAPKRASMTDLDVARLRVDREKVRRDRMTSVEQQRLLTRQGKKQRSSSSSDSSDSEDKKPKARKRHRVIPKAYMM